MASKFDNINDGMAYERETHGDDPCVLPRTIICKNCYAAPLKWKRTKKGWRLFTQDGKLHSCDLYRKSK